MSSVWESVRIGDPDPSAGLSGYEQCGADVVVAGGELDGGLFWCTREMGHQGRHVATDDVLVLAVEVAA